MPADFQIRPLTLADAKTTLEIYRPYVEKTIISFEYEVPTLKDWEERIKTNTAEYPWLVCECKNEIVGYAYGSKHRYRTAYSWSPEATVYLSEKFHRLGIARILYETLFELLKLQGYVNVYAGISLPNKASEKFHEALGFYDVGVFKRIGFKFGGWHDTRWLQLHLVEHPANPGKPRLVKDIEDTVEFGKIIEEANSKVCTLKFNHIDSHR